MLDLVNFWTAGNTINQSKDKLLVKFDEGTNSMPLSETCFNTIVLPTKNKEYEDFKKNMDIALKYGSKGFSFT